MCVDAKITPNVVRPGGQICMEFVVQNRGSRPARREYQGFVHLEKGKKDCGSIVAVLDHPPIEPTTLWRKGHLVKDGHYILTVPQDATDGTYYVHVGLWSPSDPKAPRIWEAYPAEITVKHDAPMAAKASAPSMSDAEKRVRAMRLAARIRAAVGIADSSLCFRVSRSGCWELTDKATGEVWRSNPDTRRFALVSFTKGDRTVTAPVDSFSSMRARSRRLTLSWSPKMAEHVGSVLFDARLLPKGKGLRITWKQFGGDWKVSNVRFPDSSFWATGDEKGYLVVPNRMGIIVPAGENQPCVTTYPTYCSYGGCSMAMAGAVKNKSAILVWWDDPYVQLETRRTWPDLPDIPSHSMVSMSLAHTGQSGAVTIRPVGRGGYVEIAKAYRNVARERGFLATWRDKYPSGDSPMAGCAYFRTLALFNYVPHTRYNETDQRNRRVGYTFAEIAETAEHLSRDLGIDRAMYVISGWGKNGYDNQVPDVLPATAECGGNEGLADCSRRVKALGYLFGLHDNYQDMYADAPSWNDKYIMRNRDGSLKAGGVWFGGQCYIVNSRLALDLARREQNIPSVKRLFDPDFYYIDTTFAVPLYEDFSSEHPLTYRDDIYWKQQLCKYARNTFGAFGSEEGVEWGVPCADYFESMLFQRTQRMSTEVLIPLFEMVYGDCVNIYQGDRTTTGSPDYVLDHILCAEMPQCNINKAGAPDISCRIASARRTGPSTIEVTYEWRVGDRAPRKDYSVFAHFPREGVLYGARESAAFSENHRLESPSSNWIPGSVHLDGPHAITVPEGTEGDFNVLAGLVDDGDRVPLLGIDVGNCRFLIGCISIDGDQIRVSAPEPTPDLCFARCDNNPKINYNAEGLLLNVYSILSPLQRLTANSPMTGHEFLTSDRKVERSRFGDVVITVNYSEKPFDTGRALLPRWGFLVESARMVAFRADSYAGQKYGETTMIVATSDDGRPLTSSDNLNVYRAYGDRVVKIAGRTVNLDNKAD